MVKKLSSIFLISVVASFASSVNASTEVVAEIAPYVYPANVPSSPSAMFFMPDGVTYLQPSADKTRIERYDTRSGECVETVFDASHTRDCQISSFEGFTVSDDGNKLLIYTDSQPIYRHSFKAEYYTFDISRNILKKLSDSGKKQQSPVFSPDGRSVAFVIDNNIRLRKLDYDTEIEVTKDGEPGTIINGIPDWTYEEEFATSVSMAWAPDSQTLCFLKYDETSVPSYSLTLYEGSCNSRSEYALYPGQFTYKYPVAGENNSTVTLHSYDLSTRKIKDLPLGDFHPEYIPRICYGPTPEQLLAVTLNREQNRLEIFSVNPKSTVSKSLFVEQSDSWILPEAYEKLALGADSFVIFSDRSGFTQLYEYSYNGSPLRTLTSGDYDVTDCYGVDPNGNVYFQSAFDSPLNRTVSVYELKKGKVTHLSNTGSTSSATFSPDFKWMTLRESSAQRPPVYTLCNNAGKCVRELENNNEYADRFKDIPTKEFFTIPSDGCTLNAYIIKPKDFNPARRYPVIMTQYSGPGSQNVLNQWHMDWEYYAASQGYIVVSVDGRGTGGRGRRFRSCVYRNLGHYETIDQINAANWLGKQPYVDATRIGMTGWSYGGYETLMSMTDVNSPFATGVAIAPVTDWKYYDTVYAERYMLTPQSNYDGYEKSAPLNRAANLKGNVLLMYGTFDDNVHPANTIEFVSKLQSYGTLCDMLLFPNMNHSIYGCNSRAVVYGKMMDYFNKNL